MILLEMKIPQLSKPEATAARNQNSIGDRMEKKTLGETRLSWGASSPLARRTMTKVTVYQAVCVTILLYSCEAWVTYSHHIRSLERFHISYLQRILGVTWQDRMPHIEIFKKANYRSIEAMITQCQVKWLGHVIRMPPCRLPRRVLYTASYIMVDVQLGGGEEAI